MRDPRYRPLWVAGALALAGGLIVTLPSPSQSQTMNATSSLVAVSSVENQHIHSLALRAADLDPLISQLSSSDDGATVAFESSSAYNGTAGSGGQHTHTVRFNRQQLMTLRDTGTLSVTSEFNSGHRHNFQFIREAECAAIAVVVPPPPGPSVSVSPSPSVSVSPSVSPSPSVSVSPSPAPSESPSNTPSGTPSTAPSASPQPIYTILSTATPGNIPTGIASGAAAAAGASSGG